MEPNEKLMSRTRRPVEDPLAGAVPASCSEQRPMRAEPGTRDGRLGSAGEQALQERLGSRRRALAFYANQVLDHLNPTMRAFIARQELCFIATADAGGRCDCSLRAGPAGFVQVADARHLWYPEYRGNGVMASLANLTENPHIGLIFIDFFATAVGLHVNGRAAIVEIDAPELTALAWPAEPQPSAGRQPRPERWVRVEVEEVYIHCSKHVPLLQKLDKQIWWDTDSAAFKGGDYFRTKGTCPIETPDPAVEAAIA
jgi:predicted pyridoxine 5'-phosphate oxidase superfamily flavin-nucleotide-binding protein